MQFQTEARDSEPDRSGQIFGTHTGTHKYCGTARDGASKGRITAHFYLVWAQKSVATHTHIVHARFPLSSWTARQIYP